MGKIPISLNGKWKRIHLSQANINLAGQVELASVQVKFLITAPEMVWKFTHFRKKQQLQFTISIDPWVPDSPTEDLLEDMFTWTGPHFPIYMGTDIEIIYNRLPGWTQTDTLY